MHSLSSAVWTAVPCTAFKRASDKSSDREIKIRIVIGVEVAVLYATPVVKYSKRKL